MMKLKLILNILKFVFLLYLLVALLSPIFTYAQVPISKNYINSITKKGDYLSGILLFEKSLELYKKANKLSIQIHDRDGMIRTDFKIASTLNSLGDYKGCFNHLDMIESKYENDLSKNPEYQYLLIEITGLNYLKYDFKRQAALEFKKLPELIDKAFSNSDIKKEKLIRAYIGIASCYEFVDNDLAYYYMRKAASVIKSRNLYNTLNIPKNFQRNVLSVYRNLADYKQYFSKDLDSAYYYNDKVLALGQHINSPYMFIFNRQRAQILYSDKKYNLSLEYCEKALKQIKEKAVKEDLIDVYKLMAENYRAMGNLNEASYYSEKYIPLKDSLVGTRTEGIIVSSDYLNSKQRENISKQKKVREKYFLVGVIVIILVSLVSILMIARYRKRQKELHFRLQLKKQKLLEKDLEKVQLEKKINDSFDEILQLAKTNSSSFFARFQEIYPFFTPQLLNVESKLQSSELTFCAYIFLNFSTKEIATYTFTSVKTVQNRKNHIRKKLLIPSDKDIYVWMKETVTS
ncbi:tetratricopeptide repeat protein [Chryseobacterium sp. FH1]|uniref:tetratricopeptide repeat protein n=1 Tax=Chryseobacterium sp. FH1 TaxID=1233951 RepID=UPI0004E2B102|nr:hypothetical protein [Chryseobacterium sp. FH1]KFC20039.1 hypothetical protein IO90_12575 [Chryseobacterium sp. FH1]